MNQHPIHLSRIAARHAVAGAVALLVAAAANAQTAPSAGDPAPATATAAAAPLVQVYGLVDVDAQRAQPAGAQALSLVSSGGMSTSYWGVRGGQDVGDGIRAIFDITGFLRVDTGAQGRFDGDTAWSRYAWVGLQTPYGTFRGGRQSSPSFINTIIYNPFGDSPGYNPVFAQNYVTSAGEPMMTGSGATDNAWSNTLGYTSPDFDGVTFVALAAPSEGTTAGRRASIGVRYRSTVWGAGLSADRLEKMGLLFSRPQDGPPPAPAGFVANEGTTINAGGWYDLGVVKLYAQAVSTRLSNATQDVDLTTRSLGLSAPLGKGHLLLDWGSTRKSQTHLAAATRNTTSAGYDYNLASNIDLYAVVSLDALTAKTTGTTYGAGLRYRFP